jgi:electron transfer flavoprotein alpha subunit
LIEIDKDICSGCCGCVDHCPVAAINVIDDVVVVDNDICMECLICTKVCPLKAPKVVDQAINN